MTTLYLERQTKEFIGAGLLVDGVAPDAATVKFCLKQWLERPADWVNAYSLDGEIGYLYDPATVEFGGTYKLWAQITDTPEVVVILCGNVVFTGPAA